MAWASGWVAGMRLSGEGFCVWGEMMARGVRSHHGGLDLGAFGVGSARRGHESGDDRPALKSSQTSPPFC